MSDPVPTLADLESGSFDGTPLAVLGHPIAHSLSPPMHNAALELLARSDPAYARWRYFRFDVPPADLPRALDLLHERGFLGVNLTLPHKVIALDRVREVSPEARAAGAVNTLRRSGSGWAGSNTDGYGLSAALRQELGLELAGARVVLLGAGGAARGAAVECLRRGCAGLWILNRSRPNLDALLEVLRPLAGPIPVAGLVSDGSSGLEALGGAAGAVVVNATSAGLKESDPAPVDLARLPRPAAVFDMVYNPPRTPLLARAAELGLPRANGLAMLVHQGAKSLEAWTGASAELTAPAMMAAARAAL